MISSRILPLLSIFFIGAVQAQPSLETLRNTCEEISSVTCTMEFVPVCGQKSDVDETYPNSCVACSESAVVYYTDGPCENVSSMLHAPHNLEDESPIMGTIEDDVIHDTFEFDQIWGGPGADTFVLDQLSAVPDEIMDFDPSEGDVIQLSFLKQRKLGKAIQQGKLSINRKGVVMLTLLDGDTMPLVNINRTDLTVSFRNRKNKFELKFETRF